MNLVANLGLEPKTVAYETTEITSFSNSQYILGLQTYNLFLNYANI